MFLSRHDFPRESLQLLQHYMRQCRARAQPWPDSGVGLVWSKVEPQLCTWIPLTAPCSLQPLQLPWTVQECAGQAPVHSQQSWGGGETLAASGLHSAYPRRPLPPQTAVKNQPKERKKVKKITNCTKSAREHRRNQPSCDLRSGMLNCTH